MPREMYTRKDTLMVSFNKAYGVVRESKDNIVLDWAMNTEAYYAVYVGLDPANNNAGISQANADGSVSVRSLPKTCAIWMR
jgi:hypothetical protein